MSDRTLEEEIKLLETIDVLSDKPFSLIKRDSIISIISNTLLDEKMYLLHDDNDRLNTLNYLLNGFIQLDLIRYPKDNYVVMTSTNTRNMYLLSSHPTDARIPYCISLVKRFETLYNIRDALNEANLAYCIALMGWDIDTVIEDGKKGFSGIKREIFKSVLGSSPIMDILFRTELSNDDKSFKLKVFNKLNNEDKEPLAVIELSLSKDFYKKPTITVRERI